MGDVFLTCFYLCPNMVNWQQYFFRTIIGNWLRLSNRSTGFSRCSSVPLINKLLLLIYMTPKTTWNLDANKSQSQFICKREVKHWLDLWQTWIFLWELLFYTVYTHVHSVQHSTMNFSLFLKNQNGMHNLFSTRYQSNTSAKPARPLCFWLLTFQSNITYITPCFLTEITAKTESNNAVLTVLKQKILRKNDKDKR